MQQLQETQPQTQAHSIPLLTVASVPAERRAIPIADQTFDYVVVGGGTAGSVIAG
jgi:hypothetical protein